jgi:DNA invertase Pin-like site-specific DNA recombinase
MKTERIPLKITKEVKKQILKLLEKGVSIDEIARQIEVSKTIIYKHIPLSEMNIAKIKYMYKGLSKEQQEEINVYLTK